MTVPAASVALCRRPWLLSSISPACAGSPAEAATSGAPSTRASGTVLYAAWDPEDDALRGMVRGQDNNVYQTAAFFSLTDGRPAEFELGECSCPVEFNCKHVVALVLSALASPAPPGRGPGAEPAAGRLGEVAGLAAGPGRLGAPRHDAAGDRACAGRRRGPGPLGRRDGGAGAAAADRPAGPAGQERRLGRRRPELGQAGRRCATPATTARSRCGCCGNCTCSTRRAGAAAATTAITTVTTGRSSSPRSARGSSGRCSTRPRRPACGWCTRASAACWPDTRTPSSAWT